MHFAVQYTFFFSEFFPYLRRITYTEGYLGHVPVKRANSLFAYCICFSLVRFSFLISSSSFYIFLIPLFVILYRKLSPVIFIESLYMYVFSWFLHRIWRKSGPRRACARGRSRTAAKISASHTRCLRFPSTWSRKLCEASTSLSAKLFRFAAVLRFIALFRFTSVFLLGGTWT